MGGQRMLRKHGWLYLGLLIPIITLAGCGQTAFHIELVPTDRQLQETQIQKDAGLFVSDKIAIIDVDGMLANRRKGGWMRSGENPVKAVVLRLNSPGGTVAASDIMYHHLMEFRRQTGKPVIACVLGTGCSGTT